MSAENPEAPQGVDLSFLEGINQPVEPTPAPAPAAETLAQENTDDAAVRLFQTKIEEYPDRATARKHYKEIADSLGVSKQLGYKAEKRVEKWKSNKQKPRPMTMKIAKAEPPNPTP
jgi:DNA invertase Pin-like site-specific DNA recombinase